MTPSDQPAPASGGAARRRPHRPQLRTRVLAGVLLITVTALVGFDVSAVTALRRYLLSHTDEQLGSVLNLYRPLALRPGAVYFKGPSGLGRARPSPVVQRQVRRSSHPRAKRSTIDIHGLPITGPHFQIAAPLLDQYFLEYQNGKGQWRVLVDGNPTLRPRITADRASWVRSPDRTVLGYNGQNQLRLQAVPIAGGVLVAATSLAEVDKTVDRLKLILIIGSVIAGLLVAVGVALVVRRGLRPIETMATQADRISAGDLNERVSPTGAETEVGRLGAALNGMLARIETSIREREASQELTRRFFADASHELRNPLASLRANAELYQQGVLREPDEVGEAMRRIALEAQRMSGLVDDMLRLARLDQHPDQRYDEVDISDLVACCAERTQAAEPARAWLTDIEPDLVSTGDTELLRRAVDNLMANVRAHTPPDAIASIRATGHDGTVTIEVSDDGPGVPQDQLPHIFDRFYRAGTQSYRPGSGLGLAIVTATAAAHGGSAQAALNEPHGLRITLSLPVISPAELTCPGERDDEPDRLTAGRPP